MEKLKLFSREQVGNAPLTGRQYSRPDSLSLVSRQSVLAFLLVLLTTVFGVGNAWAVEGDVVYKLNTITDGGTPIATGNSYSAYGPSDCASAQSGSTVSTASWKVTYGSKQTSGVVGLWLGSNSSKKSGMKLATGNFSEAAAIATAIGAETSSTYYAALICETEFANVGKVTLSYSGVGNKTPSSAWIVYSTDEGTSWSVAKKLTSLNQNGTDFEFDATIASARYALVIYYSDYCSVKAPVLTFYEGASGGSGQTYSITPEVNNASYGSVSLSGSVITATPNAGYRYANPAYTVSGGTATVTQGTGDNINKFTVSDLTADVTVTINFEAIPTYTVSFSTGTGNQTVNAITETTGGAGITLPAGPTPACSDDGWSFAGWAEADVAAETATAPTLFAADANYKPTGDVTLYAVYKRSEGAVFDGNTAGDFYIYAEISGTKYYATAFAKKLNSTTDVNSAVKFTFEKIIENETTYFAIKSGEAYLSYGTSGTDFTFNGTDQYKWQLTSGTYGTWRLIASSASGRALTFRGGTSNVFGPYATSNINGTDYYDIEIGAGTTYYLSAPSCCTKNAITIAKGIENGSVSADLSEACEGTKVTLTATPDGSYHFYAWNVVDGESNPVTVTNNQFTMPATAVTVSATFAHDECTNLEAPTLDAITKDYKSATIAWNAVTDAVSYVLNVAEHDGDAVLTDESITATSKELTGLKAETQYDYSVMAVGDGSDKCAEGNALLEGNFTTEALPTVKLTLMNLGVEHEATANHPILTPFNLPTEAAGCSKTFVGWDTEANCETAPAYAAGAEFTFNDETPVTLYAVYAKATAGAKEYVKTAFANIASGSVVVVTEKVGDDIYAASNNNGTSAAPSVIAVTETNDKLTAGVTADALWTLTKDGDNFSLAAGDNKMYCTATNNGVRVGSNANNVFSIKDNYLYNNATSRYLGVYSDNGTPQDFRCYTSINANIKDQTLAFYVENSQVSYSNYSTSCTAALAAPTFSLNPDVDPVNDKYTEAINVVITNKAAEGTIYYTLDGSTPTSESTEYTGAITLDKCGTTTIKAIAITNDNQSAVAEAEYTLEMAIPTVSAEDPYTEAEAVAVYNSGCYNNEEDVYVTGTVKTAQFFKSNTYTITLTDGFQFYYFYEGANEQTFTSDYIKAGDVLVACGKLDKHNSTYQLGQGCYLVSRTEAQKTPIESSLEEPITVAAAIDYIDKAAIYDLSEDEYVKGVITAIGQTSGETPIPYIDVKDADQDNTFRFFNYTINNDITETPAVYDVVIAVGKLDKFYNTYELNGCEVVALTKNTTPVSSVTVTETATVKAGKTVQLTATVLPENAANKNVTWSVNSGTDYASVSQEGVVTGIAAGGEAVIEVKTVDGNFTATCTVTVTEGDYVYAYYNYEKVTATADITDGEYLIVYEGDATHAAVAFKGSLETLDAAGNGIAVEIEEGKIEGTDALHAATFTIDATAGTLQSASGKYIGVSSNSNGLSVSEDAETYTHNFSIDEDKNAVIAAAFVGSTMTLRYNYASDQLRFRYFKNSGQQAIALYKKVGTDDAPKAKPELAFDPETVTLKLGEDFTAPMLGYAEGFNGLAAITYASSDEDVAVVGETTGEVTIKAVGEAIITATFAGNANYKAGTASYTITVNAADAPDPVYYIKVTSAPADWSGEYLLVYEDGANAYVWNGDYTDGANNYASATISENKIAIPTGAAVITIAAASEDKYTLLVNGEKYFQDNGSNAKLQFVDAVADAAKVSISYETDWVKILFSERCIRFNSDNGQKRFRYYADSSQKAVQLYKKEGTYTTVRKELAPNAYYTMCLDQEVTAVRGASIWRVLSKAQNDKDVILEEVTGTLDAGRPYIFYATADKLEVVYDGEAVNAPVTTGNNGLIGSFTQEKITQSPDNYIIYNNELYFVNSDKVYVGAHRAYLNMAGVPDYNNNEPVQGNAPRRRVTMAVHGEQVATDIDNVQGDNIKATKVLINGQLYIMYNGTMYNVQGQLVR